MKRITFFDTETTGLPDWSTPSGDDNQPHIVQLAAITVCAETREIIETSNVLIKPEGWAWDSENEAFKAHGITAEKALAEGISESAAIQQLLDSCGDGLRVSFNRTFDQRIIRIGLKRYFDEAQQEAWAETDNFHCAMMMAKPFTKLPNPNPKGRGFKNPKLSEAYEFFTGKTLEGAHDALIDTQACMEIYWAIQDQQKVAAA